MVKYIGYVGIYIKGGSEGIYCFEFDIEVKQFSQLKFAVKFGNLIYVILNFDNSMLYFIEKVDGKGGVAVY